MKRKNLLFVLALTVALVFLCGVVTVSAAPPAKKAPVKVAKVMATDEIRTGDSRTSIAKAKGVSESDLKAWNPKVDWKKVGSKYQYRDPYFYDTVQLGETWPFISQWYGIPIGEMAKLNPEISFLKPAVPGQRYRLIPKEDQAKAAKAAIEKAMAPVKSEIDKAIASANNAATQSQATANGLNNLVVATNKIAEASGNTTTAIQNQTAVITDLKTSSKKTNIWIGVAILFVGIGLAVLICYLIQLYVENERKKEEARLEREKEESRNHAEELKAEETERQSNWAQEREEKRRLNEKTEKILNAVDGGFKGIVDIVITQMEEVKAGIDHLSQQVGEVKQGVDEVPGKVVEKIEAFRPEPFVYTIGGYRIVLQMSEENLRNQEYPSIFVSDPTTSKKASELELETTKNWHKAWDNNRRTLKNYIDYSDGSLGDKSKISPLQIEVIEHLKHGNRLDIKKIS